MLNLKTKQEKQEGRRGRKEGEGKGRERRGGDPLVDPVSLPWEVVPGCSCVGGCHPEMACSSDPHMCLAQWRWGGAREGWFQVGSWVVRVRSDP